MLSQWELETSTSTHLESVSKEGSSGGLMYVREHFKRRNVLDNSCYFDFKRVDIREPSKDGMLRQQDNSCYFDFSPGHKQRSTSLVVYTRVSHGRLNWKCQADQGRCSWLILFDGPTCSSILQRFPGRIIASTSLVEGSLLQVLLLY